MKKISLLFVSFLFVLCGCQNKLDDSNNNNTTSPDHVIETPYFTVTLPSHWDDDLYNTQIVSADKGTAYTINFNEKESYEEFEGGYLFGISLYDEGEDYSYLPSYEVLGVLKTNHETFDVIVEYPTDVQFSEETSDEYRMLSKDIDDILLTIKAKDGYTYTKKN